jgi:hypothetical protein
MSDKERRVYKYQIFPCKGGYLLNTHFSATHVESEVIVSGMTLLTKIAHLEGLLDDDAWEPKSEPLS